MVRSSHKNIYSKKTKSIFNHFYPSLPVLLKKSILDCQSTNLCGTLSQVVSVHGFAEAAQQAVWIRADSNAVKMCIQAIMPHEEPEFCNCLSPRPVWYFGYFVLPRFMGEPCLQFMSLYTNNKNIVLDGIICVYMSDDQAQRDGCHENVIRTLNTVHLFC